MKMARCSPEGVEAMLRLTGILGDVFEDGQYPRSAETGEFDDGAPDYFDVDDEKHLRALYARLEALLSRDSDSCGDLRRVTFGYYVMTDPDNRLIAPAADCLAFHPRFAALETAANRALEYLRGVAPLLDGDGPEAGCGKVIANLEGALAQFEKAEKAEVPA